MTSESVSDIIGKTDIKCSIEMKLASLYLFSDFNKDEEMMKRALNINNKKN